MATATARRGSDGPAAPGSTPARRSGRRGRAGAPDPKSAPDGRSYLWLQGLVCGAVATLATPTAVLGLALFAPALVAAMTERREGRPLTRVLALFGAAGGAGPLVHLWSGGHTLALALTLAGDPAVIGLAYALAGLGWLLSEVGPLVLRAAMEAQAAARAVRLRAARRRLSDAWSLAADPPGD